MPWRLRMVKWGSESGEAKTSSKEPLINSAAHPAVPFPPCISCRFFDLGAVQKLFIQNAKDEFVSARRRREACRGTLTDDNAAMADSDKHNV